MVDGVVDVDVVVSANVCSQLQRGERGAKVGAAFESVVVMASDHREK